MVNFNLNVCLCVCVCVSRIIYHMNCAVFQIEVKAVPIDKKEIGDSDQGRKMRRVSQPDALTFGGHAHPSLDTPYEVTIKDKMCYYAITIMKVCLLVGTILPLPPSASMACSGTALPFAY